MFWGQSAPSIDGKAEEKELDLGVDTKQYDDEIDLDANPQGKNLMSSDDSSGFLPAK